MANEYKQLELLITAVISLFIFLVKATYEVIHFMWETFSDVRNDCASKPTGTDIQASSFLTKATNVSTSNSSELINTTITSLVNKNESVAKAQSDVFTLARYTTSDRATTTKKVLAIANNPTVNLEIKWRYDLATDRQIKYIRNLVGLKTYSQLPEFLTKGQASDIIGLFHEPEDEDWQFLEELNATHDIAKNQTEFRWKVELILGLDNAEKLLLELEEATAQQKEEIRFLGGKAPNDLRFKSAEAQIKLLRDAMPEQAQEFDNLKLLYKKIADLSSEMHYDRQKFTRFKFNKIYKTLKEKGISYEEIESNPSAFIELLKQFYPSTKL